MRSKVLSVVVGSACIITAALRQDGPGSIPAASQAAAYLAVIGIICVLCSGFLGGFTRRSGYSRIADSPSLYGGDIFNFLGWALLITGSAIAIWLHL